MATGIQNKGKEEGAKLQENKRFLPLLGKCF